MAGSVAVTRRDSLHLLNLELRHVESSHLTKIALIIDRTKAWTKLLEELTRPDFRHYDGNKPLASLDLSLDSINLIEQQLYCGKSPTLALLNHWSITGRRRPTVKSLLICLHISNLKWAEKYLCQSVLSVESIDQVLLAKPLTPREEFGYSIDKAYKFQGLGDLVKGLKAVCPRYSFKMIYESTNGFCHEPYNLERPSGAKIGEGRFSSVFRARSHIESLPKVQDQQIVAAKLLKSECNEKYLINEINLMAEINHENIIKLLGISLGVSTDMVASYICLVYKYMENGSLLDCLSFGLPTEKMRHLKWEERTRIAFKVATGISHLHSFHGGPIIHRDIKTANIFIDSDLEPKIGDFTLIRQLDSLRTAQTQFSQNIIGTSVYMPPEAFRGDISVKFDTFSFGIVLLELLTGLKPFNEELDEDLFTFINEKMSDIDDELGSEEPWVAQPSTSRLAEARDGFLEGILDKKAGRWNFECAKVLFELSLLATETRKKNRPEVSSTLPRLEAALSHCD